MLTTFECAPPGRVVRGRHGWFLVQPGDVYVGRALLTYGEFCEHERELLGQLLGQDRDAVEVGANIGALTVPMARQLGGAGRQLHAIEAQPAVYQQLCANLALNALDNVRADNVACSDAPGWLGFDALLPGDADIGVIKIDVEGFEQRVLEGARSTIDRCRPFLYLENDRVDRSRALIEWLWAAGYDLYWHIAPLFNPGNFAGEAVDIYPGKASFNMLATPRELATPVAGLTRIP
ncbi:MAG: FkbM family methyltransferase, partial [Gammaproteobacteria bacterium]|nr:FkbM family methyltransferase [Gammaproteobacteria bacterium]